MRAALPLGALCLLSAKAALALTPQDFAYGMPIMPTAKSGRKVELKATNMPQK